MDSTWTICEQVSSTSWELPPELWAVVFEKACTDDGTTGRSLSLVSQRFAALCNQLKYNSIEIRGRNQVEAFHEMILARPDRETPRVRHLLLDLRCMYPTIPLNGKRSGRHVPRPGEPGYSEEMLDLITDDRKITFRNSMMSLLGLLSPHVATLAIIFTGSLPTVRLDLPLPEETFPLLSELTICGAPYYSNPIRAHFPALKYLHLSYCAIYFKVFCDKIPALTHLRLTAPDIAPGHKGSRLPIDRELIPKFERLAICPDYRDFERTILPHIPQDILDITDILLPAVYPGILNSTYVEIEKDWMRGVEGRGSYW